MTSSTDGILGQLPTFNRTIMQAAEQGKKKDLNIPTPTLNPRRSPEFNEAFTEGFKFGYVAGTRDSFPAIDSDMRLRASAALYEKIYGQPYDGENLRMIGIRDYVNTVLTAALNNPK